MKSVNRTSFYVFLVLLAVCFSITGCIPNQYTSDQVLGTWHVQEENMFYTFNEDGTGQSYDQYGSGLNFTWSLSGGKNINIRYQGQQTSSSAWENFVISAISGDVMTCYDEFDSDRRLHFERVNI